MAFINGKNYKKLKNKKIIYFAGVIAIVLINVTGIFSGISKINKYRSAENDFKNNRFSEARQVFQELGDFEDSKNKAKECIFRMGKDSFEKGNYEDSMKYFNSISGYKNADVLYVEAEHKNIVSKDTTPPEFSEFPDSKEFAVGSYFNVRSWCRSEGITVTDNVTKNIQYTADKGNLNVNVPGEYTIVIRATDEAGNTTEKEVSVTVREKDSRTRDAYLETVLLAGNFMKRVNGVYYFKGIPIISEETDQLASGESFSLKRGALYRSLAKELNDFYLLDEGTYDSWKPIADEIFNFSPPATWSEMKPYVDEACTFITRDNSEKVILNKLKTSQCVTGDIDSENMKFNFTIADTSMLADEWNINEAMLGYTLAVFSEYNAMPEFNGTTCTFVLD